MICREDAQCATKKKKKKKKNTGCIFTLVSANILITLQLPQMLLTCFIFIPPFIVQPLVLIFHSSQNRQKLVKLSAQSQSKVGFEFKWSGSRAHYFPTTKPCNLLYSIKTHKNRFSNDSINTQLILHWVTLSQCLPM